MKRRMWLEHPDTKEIWDLMPTNPNDINGGCALVDPKGMGYQQEVTQEQVETDYFISNVQSKNKTITGVLMFNGDEHLEHFQEFVGDFRRQFKLFYSPSAEYEPYDRISSPFYKYITISQVDKTEKDEYGWYQCSVTFTTQNDVWKRDISLGKDISVIEDVGEALVYPYTYEYVMGGRDVFSIELPNDGRETGCAIRIKNKGDTPINQLEWFIENRYVDYYGIEQVTVQRSKWYTQKDEKRQIDVTLRNGYELYVDSNPITQEAKVNYPDGTSQSIVAWQEPSWDYINFVRIKHGTNRIVFYLTSKDVEISVTYQEQKEII